MTRGDSNFKTGSSEEPEQERNQTSEDQKKQIGEILGENPEEESQEEPETQPKGEESQEEEEETRTREEPEGEGEEEEETRTREEPEGEQKEEDDESEETEASTEEQLRDELNDVYGELEELREQVEGEQETSSEEDEETEEEETETQTSQEELDFEDRQFVTDEEIEEFQDDPTKINDFLNRVFQESLEEAMRRIPNVVTSKVSRNMTMRERAKEFYKENSDLQEYRDFVGHVANEVQSDNPEMDIQQVFEKTAKVARNRLGIKKKAQDTEEERRKGGEGGQGPAFAGKPRGSRKGSGKDTRDGQQKQIDEMLDT